MHKNALGGRALPGAARGAYNTGEGKGVVKGSRRLEGKKGGGKREKKGRETAQASYIENVPGCDVYFDGNAVHLASKSVLWPGKVVSDAYATSR